MTEASHHFVWPAATTHALALDPSPRLADEPARRKHIVTLTESELHELADLALDDRMELGEYGPEYRAMVMFAGYVGLRPGELFARRTDDVSGALCAIERSLSSTGE